MSTIKVDTITDEAGSGAPDFPNGMTGNGSALTGIATAAQGTLADTALQAASSLTAANLTGALPAIDGSALTGVGGSTTTGDVGTYAYLIATTGNIGVTPATSYAGSGLRYAAQSTNSITSSSGYNVGHTYSSGPSGTWRAMGGRTTTGTYTYVATLYVRIS